MEIDLGETKRKYTGKGEDKIKMGGRKKGEAWEMKVKGGRKDRKRGRRMKT